ncbi:MAG: hypothetical protein ACLGIM_16295 [Alphaproteobacteria bacterium]
MQVFFPTIGTQIILDAEWSFRLYDEYRNDTLIRALGFKRTQSGDYYNRYGFPQQDQYQHCTTVVLPAGTVLQIDRIYLRKGMSDYDSLTFAVLDSAMESLLPWKKNAVAGGAVRFWTKLDDANAMPGSFTKGRVANIRRENADIQKRD